MPLYPLSYLYYIIYYTATPSLRLDILSLYRWVSGYFLYFLLNKSECVPVLSMTKISSWSCCSSLYLFYQIIQTIVLVHAPLVKVAQRKFVGRVELAATGNGNFAHSLEKADGLLDVLEH